MLINSRNYEIAVAYGDMHIPFADAMAQTLLLDIIKDVKPDIVIDGGDLMNCTCISGFKKSYDQLVGLQQEIDEARQWLQTLRICSGRARIVLLKDNHLFRRLADKIKDEPWLGDLRCLEPSVFLGCKESGVECVNNFIFEDYYFSHGDDCGGSSECPVNTSRRISKSKGISYVRFHSHTTAHEVHRQADGSYIQAIQLGTLHDLSKIDYIKHPDLCNWSQSLGIFTVNKSNGLCFYQPVLIQDHVCVVNNKEYKA